ncbi:MAG: hypothetical protein JKY92_01090 [Magnetovibrio sp.]|nr:hypothetical protein [Magnetovibrio sp.]
MPHLLHEVKDELDWAMREVMQVESEYSALELRIQTAKASPEGKDRDQLIKALKEQKDALKLSEIYDILGRAARRFSLLTRVFEVGSQHNELEDIVVGLMDGILFQQNDTGADTDDIIFQIAEALLDYFHYELGDESDARLRDAWLGVENLLRNQGRKI